MTGQLGSELDERIIQINRVSRKTKGGNRISFSILTVVGNRQGRVGAGLGKARDVAGAIQKSFRYARKSMIEIPLVQGTIPHWVEVKYKAARLLLKPAPAGSGVIAGGPLRSVVAAAGIRNVVGKIYGSDNKLTNVQAAMIALSKLKKISRDFSPKTKPSPKKDDKT